MPEESSLQAHRILVALWCTMAVYFPILTILLICYELIMVLKNCPGILDEIEWIVDWAKDFKKWLMKRPVEPEKVQKLIGMVLQQRKETLNSGDWEEIESDC